MPKKDMQEKVMETVHPGAASTMARVKSRKDRLAEIMRNGTTRDRLKKPR